MPKFSETTASYVRDGNSITLTIKATLSEPNDADLAKVDELGPVADAIMQGGEGIEMLSKWLAGVAHGEDVDISPPVEQENNPKWVEADGKGENAVTGEEKKEEETKDEEKPAG